MGAVFGLLCLPGLSLGAGRCDHLLSRSWAQPVSTTEKTAAIPVLPVKLVGRYPHDPATFTQGLLYHAGNLYESTGLKGQSGLQRIELPSGRIIARRRLADTLFGEGLALVNDELVQLTWQAGLALRYQPQNLKPLGDFHYPGEGWGLTTLGQDMIVSDGSARLRYISVLTHHETRRLEVAAHGQPLTGLNELETVDGQLFANIYPGDCIARIDPASGQVTGWLDIAHLLPLADRPDSSAVANGIAWDSDRRELLVTGKFWPYIYRLKLKKSLTPAANSD